MKYISGINARTYAQEEIWPPARGPLHLLAKGDREPLISNFGNISPTVARHLPQAPARRPSKQNERAQLERTGWSLSGRREVCRHGIHWMLWSSQKRQKKVPKVGKNRREEAPLNMLNIINQMYPRCIVDPEYSADDVLLQVGGDKLHLDVSVSVDTIFWPVLWTQLNRNGRDTHACVQTHTHACTDTYTHPRAYTPHEQTQTHTRKHKTNTKDTLH